MPPRELLQWWHLFEMQFLALLRAIFVPAMTLESNFFQICWKAYGVFQETCFLNFPKLLCHAPTLTIDDFVR